MRFHLTCRCCRTQFRVSPALAGQKIPCPNPECGQTFRVPAGKSAALPGPSAQPETPQHLSKTKLIASPRPARERMRRRPMLPMATAIGVLAVVVGAFLFRDLVPAPAPQFNHDGVAIAPPALSGQLVAAETPAEETPENLEFIEVVQPFLKTYCVECHGAEFAEADLNLDTFGSLDSLKKERDRWNHILQIVRIGAMPPSDYEPQPATELRLRVVDWLDHTLNYVDCSMVDDPGHVTIRRLNRVEYNNTIRDLIGVDFEPAADFPSDDVGNGFDNQGAVLTLPPLLMEKYLDAAEAITSKAIVSDFSSLLTVRKDGGSLPSRGEVSHKFLVKPGKYKLRAEVEADQAGDELAKASMLHAGQTLRTVEVTGEDEPNLIEVEVEVKEAGEQAFAISFLNDHYNTKAADGRIDRNLRVNWIELYGPENSKPELPETHERLVIATPDSAGSVEAAAKKVFEAFVPRAFRRPAEPIEVSRLVSMVQMAVEQGETFEQGIAYGVQAALVSPHFLYRVEDDFQTAEEGKALLGEYELASRLSYFLWSTMPDQQLFELASQGKLSDPEILEQQVRRMLADEKTDSLVVNFFGQWLNLRNLDEIEPDPQKYPWWNSRLRIAMRKETELFCRDLVREDRPIMDVLRADYTYMNPRLAELYGLDWKGEDPKKLYYEYEGERNEHDYQGRRRSGPYTHEDEYVRVSLPENRRGVLTHASVLTLTSNPGDTSPVKRGKWIMENLLGTPPPPPPPGVPPIEDIKNAKPTATLREQLELHRTDPGCASCHKVMDPLGLGFEHFDVIGQWRDKDGKVAIDAQGQLSDHEAFQGAIELIGLLEKRDEQITRFFVEKLMMYGLGRGLEPYDRCAVDEILSSAREDEYRFSAIVIGIVESDPFRKSRQN